MNLTTIAIVAFVAGAISPSFIDWQQADEHQRNQIVTYYLVMIGLIALGTNGR